MDSALLGSLIDRLAAALELYARQWCDAPEDVVQEAFVKLASQKKLPENPTAWLFRAVRNGAINAGVAKKRRMRREAQSVAASSAWFEENASLADRAEVDPEAAQNALEALPDNQREVIVAHVWGGLNFEQVGRLVGTSASSAHRLYHAGLNSLRERLGIPCRTNKSRPIPS